MSLKFVNRKDELAFLRERYNRENFEFFVIYGRRRIGKTELIKNFLQDKPHIYFLCDKSGTERNISRLKRKIARYLDEPPVETNDLEEILSHLVKRSNERIVIVFDEFSYLVEKDSTVPSQFQAVIDEVLRSSNTFLIFCGSSISMMEKGVLSYKSPLYGRKTAHIKLAPIPFSSFPDFFPSNSIEKNVEFYSALGGVPFHLEKFSDEKSTIDNIKNKILDKRGQLYEEMDFMLQEELREPDVYKAVLSAIAAGNTKVVRIANRSGIKAQDMDKYLKVLIRLGIVKKEIPPTMIKSKKTLYSIDDNFFSLCFLFSEPFKSDLEIGEIKTAQEKLDSEFNTFVGKKFEKLIREEILKKMGIIRAQKVGRWWGHYRDNRTHERKEIEIDIVALNETEILFGECKWRDNVDGIMLLKRLKEKAKYVEWSGKRKEFYLLSARSFRKRSLEEDVYHFDLKDMEKLLKHEKF
ncbi:MAG: Archaeal ATPase [Candidatus Methanolliviera sp. GoM_oil]|nr:MAG: Archaeal ATPase [Candidatus Methanolliviera sp. GoM_oil]